MISRLSRQEITVGQHVKYKSSITYTTHENNTPTHVNTKFKGFEVSFPGLWGEQLVKNFWPTWLHQY